MRYVLDACVLVPPVMREALLAVAATGAFTPLWSERILGEWERASARRGPVEGARALEAIAELRAFWPQSMVARHEGVERRLYLPDENDIHVLATAVAGSADAIITLNAADFPRGVLAGEGLARRDPDGLLWECRSHAPERIDAALDAIRLRAEALSGAPQNLAALLKKAHLTRLARAIRGPRM